MVAVHAVVRRADDSIRTSTQSDFFKSVGLVLGKIACGYLLDCRGIDADCWIENKRTPHGNYQQIGVFLFTPYTSFQTYFNCLAYAETPPVHSYF